MKKIQQNLKRWPGMLGIICLLAAMLSSCVKDHSDYVQQPVAILSLTDLSPDAPALDFFLNGDRVNNAAALNYKSHLDYFNVYAGHRNAIFYTSGTKTKLVSDSVNLVANRTYSLFLANVAAHADIILLADTILRPAAGKASIRLVDASPDAPNVDLAVKNGPVLVSNKTYKGFSSFVPLAVNIDTLEVRKTGTNTVLASIPTVHLQNGTVYTVVFYGLNSAVDDKKLAAGIIVNAYFY